MTARRPGTSNSLISLLSTLVSILSSHGGHVSITAKITVGIVSGLFSIMVSFCLLYNKLLNRVILVHEQEMRNHESRLRNTHT